MVIGLIGSGTGVMPATLRLSFKTSTKAERALLGRLHCCKQEATGAKADSLQKGEAFFEGNGLAPRNLTMT